MSYKRSRSTFEADDSSPYAVFGTPLPDEAESRDDGSYLPLWKQEARDEKGRRRLHGAFTGGWSAGYFNTVGSKEGWAPSNFVSSRKKRHQDGPASQLQRAEDYMDEEDLADAAEAQKLQTSQAFAGLGASSQEQGRGGGLMGLFRTEGNTMGLQLLRRMGWKDGQGIGPKIRRSARLDLEKEAAPGGKTHLFAPDDAPMIQFVRKTDRRGLGHRGEAKLRGLGRDRHAGADADDDDDADGDYNERMNNPGARPSLFAPGRSKPKAVRGAFGVGVLNDTGSDDEDAYEIGPKIKYNRVIGGDRKNKSKRATSAVANPALAIAPRFVPKTARAATVLGRCHDGRLPLDGFVLAKATEDCTALLSLYAPPPVPAGWKSARDLSATRDTSRFTSTADAARASTHDPRSRAALLGERTLPGKSVFDYLSVSARDSVAAASGRKDLPPARGEMPAGHAMPAEDRQRALLDRVPKLERDTAAAALSRSSGGPYADDDAKRARYRRYLEHQANPGLPLPERARGATDEDFVREMNDFYNCARIFRPMTGFMASRFTTAKAPLNSRGGDGASEGEGLSKPEPKLADPAEEAAKAGMFGQLTRSVEDFYPTRLLCKRFNVKAPAHSRPDEPEGDFTRSTAAAWSAPARGEAEMQSGGPIPAGGALPGPGEDQGTTAGPAPDRQPALVKVDPDRNEAVEGAAANVDVLRAIFGDDDSD